jgi:mannose-6-phosphate isomerase-like protein (cupin superfamily)
MRLQSGSDHSKGRRDRPSPLGSEIVTFIETSNLSIKEVRQGWKGRFFHSQNMTFAYYAVKAGAWIHEHSHPNDEVWNILDGPVELSWSITLDVAR